MSTCHTVFLERLRVSPRCIAAVCIRDTLFGRCVRVFAGRPHLQHVTPIHPELPSASHYITSDPVYVWSFNQCPSLFYFCSAQLIIVPLELVSIRKQNLLSSRYTHMLHVRKLSTSCDQPPQAEWAIIALSLGEAPMWRVKTNAEQRTTEKEATLRLCPS